MSDPHLERLLPQLAAALLRLRGETLNTVAAATGIRAANLSVWLRGKQQTISARRVTGLLYHLGLEDGRLRTDVLHCWADSGMLNDLKAILDVLLSAQPKRVWLFQDEKPGLTKTRFLQLDEAWIRVAVTPAATGGGNLLVITQPQRVLTLPISLAHLTTSSPQEVRDRLLEEATQTAVNEVQQDWLQASLQNLMLQLGGHASLFEHAEPSLWKPTPWLAATTDSPFSYDPSQIAGWMRLEDALMAAFRSGVTPAALASLISSHYPEGRTPPAQ